MKRLLLALVVLISPAGAADADTLIVGDQKGGSRALMEAAGVLKEVPYKVDWKEFAAAAPLLEALNAGAIDTGIVGDAPFTFAKAAGLKAKAIAAVRQNPQGLAILVRKGSPIKTVEDLEGRSVATGRGSIGHELIIALQQSRGWPKNKPHILFLAPADAKVAYGSGSVDAWSTWEPYIAQEEVLFGARTIVTGEGLTAGLSYQAATDAAIAAKRLLLADFLRRLATARAWSLTHVPSYVATWAKLVGLDVKVSTLWISRAHITLVPIEDQVIADERKTIDLYRNAGLISTDLSSSDIMDSSFRDSITNKPPASH